MKHLLKLTVGIWLLAGNLHVQAQFRAPGGLPAGFHHALLDVLAGYPSFYGRASIQVSNGPAKDSTSVSCNIAMLSGCMRLDVDDFGATLNLPPVEMTQLKTMHSVSILRPDRNRMYMVFPYFKSFVEIAYAKSGGMDVTPPPKIAKTLVRKEPVGDLACDKSQWNITETDGEQYNVTVWVATNLSPFPIQIQVGTPPALVQFQNLHWVAPNTNLFEPPADYIKYEGIQELIRKEAQKAQNTNAP